MPLQTRVPDSNAHMYIYIYIYTGRKLHKYKDHRKEPKMQLCIVEISCLEYIPTRLHTTLKAAAAQLLRKMEMDNRRVFDLVEIVERGVVANSTNIKIQILIQRQPTYIRWLATAYVELLRIRASASSLRMPLRLLTTPN